MLNRVRKNTRKGYLLILLIFALCTSALAVTNTYPKHYTYNNKEIANCTYVAWQQAHDRLGIELPIWGNAGLWYGKAQSDNYPTGTTPKVNSIVCYSGSPGHVAFVTAVSGNQITVVENGDWNGSYENSLSTSTRSGAIGATWGANTLQGYIYLDGSYANLGDDFYAVILNTDNWTPISEIDGANNIYLQTETGSPKQTWRFIRQSDGAYVIQSCNDGKVLEMSDPNNRKNNNPIYAITDDFWGGAYQQWYLIPQGNGYIFLSKHYQQEEWAMDYNSSNNAIQIYKRNNSKYQIWSVYKGSDSQLSGPKLTVTKGTSVSATKFTWNDVYGEKGFNLKIWKGSAVDYQNQYAAVNDASSGYSCTLPAGTYYAYVDAYDYFHWAQGSIVTFTISEGYTVTYNANGGTCSTSSKTVTAGSSVTLPTPTRTGYSFIGWYTAASGGTKVGDAGASYKPTKSLTIYAHWTANQYTVTLDPGGGSVSPTSIKVTYAGTYSGLPTPTRTGYTFNGWYTAASGGTKVTTSTKVTATANHTLYAQWTANQYTATLNANGGSVSPTSIKVTYAGTYSGLPTPTRTGYTFAGWYTAASGGSKVTTSTKVTATANHTLYAHWTPIEYTATLNPNGGSVSPTSIKVTYAGTYSGLPTPTRTGYTFNGWYTAASGGTKVTTSTKVTSTSNHTLYAQWTVNRYTIQWVIDGVTTTEELDYGATPAHDEPSKDPDAQYTYTFFGWFPEIEIVTGDATYTAQFDRAVNKYTVTFDASGGIAVPAQTVEYGSIAEKPDDPVRDGYSFLGWFQADAAAAYDFDTPVTADVTLTARWEVAVAVSGSVRGSFLTYTVSNAPVGALLIAARYDGRRLTEIQTVEVSGSASGTLSLGGSGSMYKLILVDSRCYAPLCEAWEGTA